VAWVFVEMGARRYRSADFPPLSASWGLFLLALLAASAIISIHTYPRATFLNQEFMVVAASISLVMVATIIIVSALASDSIEKMALSVRVFDRTTVLLVCAIPLIVGAFGACSPDTEDKTLRCFLTVGSFFIWSLLVAAWTKRLLLHNWRMTGIFTAALAIMLTPMMGALLLHSEISTAGAVIMQISPLAMVAAIWSNDDFGARLLPLAIQAALAALGMFLLHRRIRALRPPMIKPVA